MLSLGRKNAIFCLSWTLTWTNSRCWWILICAWINASKCQFNFCFTIQPLIVMSYFRMWGAYTWLGGRAGGLQGVQSGSGLLSLCSGTMPEGSRWPSKVTQLLTGPVESWELLTERQTGRQTHTPQTPIWLSGEAQSWVHALPGLRAKWTGTRWNLYGVFWPYLSHLCGWIFLFLRHFILTGILRVPYGEGSRACFGMQAKQGGNPSPGSHWLRYVSELFWASVLPL